MRLNRPARNKFWNCQCYGSLDYAGGAWSFSNHRVDLTGRFMTSEEALRIGVLHHVVPSEEVYPFAERVALDLASKPKGAMQIIKRRFFEVLEPGLEDAIKAAKRLHKESFETGEPQRGT